MNIILNRSFFENIPFLDTLIISKKLLNMFPDENEGIIDKKFANLVNKKTCATIAKNLNLKKFIKTGSSFKNLQYSNERILSDSCEELVASVPVSAPIQVEMEEPTLLEELEAKSIAGEGNARLNRRMKRKQEREIAEIIASTGLPPLPSPLPLPAIQDAEIVPTLPPVPEVDLGALPPLAELPPLRRQAVCPACNANFPVTDMMRAQVVCPICGENFSL